jgi:hypothetical protein
MTSIDTMIAYAEALARDDAHGYSQTNRTNAASPDMDCSRLVQLAVQAGGWPIGDGLLYTGNLRARLESIGWTWHPGTSGVQRGDEAGDTIGRQPGDQTGQEIRIHTALDYPWDGYLRAPSATLTTASRKAPDMQVVTSTATKTQWLLTADGTLVGLPNPEYARVAQKMVGGTLQGINAREVDVLKDLARRVKEARK